jgi:hypothetical protein
MPKNETKQSIGLVVKTVGTIPPLISLNFENCFCCCCFIGDGRYHKPGN